MFIAAYDHVICFTLLSFKQINMRWDEMSLSFDVSIAMQAKFPLCVHCVIGRNRCIPGDSCRPPPTLPPVKPGKYRDCKEIYDEIYKEMFRDRQIYYRFEVKIVGIGPDRIPTEVLCDFRELPGRKGGWTVCSKMHFNLQLLWTVAVTSILKVVMPCLV